MLPPYLPPTSAADLDADDAAACAADALRALMALDDARFWAAVAPDDTVDLAIFLDTFMRHAPRSLGLSTTGAPPKLSDRTLRKDVLLVLVRLATSARSPDSPRPHCAQQCPQNR